MFEADVTAAAAAAAASIVLLQAGGLLTQDQQVVTCSARWVLAQKAANVLLCSSVPSHCLIAHTQETMLV